MSKKKKNHEADIENPNGKTKGQNETYRKNQENRKRQLAENEKKKLGKS